MKFLYKTILMTFILLNCLYTFGQWNIQTGYDFGVIRFPNLPEWSVYICCDEFI